MNTKLLSRSFRRFDLLLPTGDPLEIGLIRLKSIIINKI